MVEDTHVLESLPAFALGCLDEAEERLVSAHIAGCYACRAELSSFREVVGEVALAVPGADPPPGLKQRAMERVQRLSPAPPRSPFVQGAFQRRFFAIGGTIGLLVILALAAATVLLWQRVNRLEVLASPQGMRAIALRSSGLAPEATGFVIISADGRNGVLVVDRMPPLAPGREYQLWLERDGESTSGGVFPVDESGYRGMRITAPVSLLEYETVRVTIEPAGGNIAPSGEQVLGGSLFNQ